MITVKQYSAHWCGPCKMVTPIMEELDKELDFVWEYIDVDDNRELAMADGVRNVPTILILDDGVEVERRVGFQPKPVLHKLITARLK